MPPRRPGPLTAVETRALRAVRRATGGTAAVPAGRALSAAGEHAAAWVLLAGAGALLQPRRRAEWLRAGGVVLAAHASSVVLKRVVRRPRPDLPDCPPLVGTPSRLSFPSSHATSTTAAALVLVPLLGGGRPVRLAAAGTVAAMGVSRVVLGVHYPSDVLTGGVLGAVVAGVARRRVHGRRDGRR